MKTQQKSGSYLWAGPGWQADSWARCGTRSVSADSWDGPGSLAGPSGGCETGPSTEHRGHKTSISHSLNAAGSVHTCIHVVVTRWVSFSSCPISSGRLSSWFCWSVMLQRFFRVHTSIGSDVSLLWLATQQNKPIAVYYVVSLTKGHTFSPLPDAIVCRLWTHCIASASCVALSLEGSSLKKKKAFVDLRPQINLVRSANIIYWHVHWNLFLNPSLCICKSNIFVNSVPCAFVNLFCLHLSVILCAFSIFETDLTP